jgi:hypothetical protein
MKHQGIALPSALIEIPATERRIKAFDTPQLIPSLAGRRSLLGLTLRAK